MGLENILGGINTLLIIAIAQGLFITLLLFHKHGALYPNRFLGLLMLIFSLSLMHVYLGEQDFYDGAIIGSFLPGVIFLMGPLHFLYTKYLIHADRKLKRIEWLHFLPLTCFMVLILLVSNGLLPRGLGATLLNEQRSGFILINWIFVIHVFVYYGFSLRELKLYSSRIREVFSNIEKVRLNWLRQLTYLIMGIMVIFVMENVLNMLSINISDFHLSSVLGAVYLYGMGYAGIYKSDIFQDPMMDELTSDEAVDEDESRVKYERSGLSDVQAQAFAVRLKDLMQQEEVYRNSMLTLHQLADMLSMSPHHLSETINGHLNMNFFDFVNQYRVDQVIKDLADDSRGHLTLLAIGLEAGFNSKTTFNNIFKKVTGKTPSQYRKELIQAA